GLGPAAGRPPRPGAAPRVRTGDHPTERTGGSRPRRGACSSGAREALGRVPVRFVRAGPAPGGPGREAMLRVPRPLVLAAASLAGSAFARGARGDEPGCNRWDLEVVCTATPMKVAIGQEFAATATVKNTGDTALANVTLQLRGDQGAPCVSGPGPVLR